MNPTSVKISSLCKPIQYSQILVQVALALILGVSLFFRVYALDRIPGINGDEAVVAVTIHEANLGKPAVLRMPTGRMFSPVYASIAFVIDQIFPRSFFALRLPSLMAGILLLIVTFLFVRRSFGTPTSLIALLLVAVSPTNIAYSRSGVEQSFTGLFGMLLCLAFSASNWWGLALLGILALVMHPIHIFYLPLLLCLLAYRLRERKYLLGIWVLVCLILSLGLLLTIPKHYFSLFRIESILKRILDPRGILQFAKHWVSLFSGTAAIEQFIGDFPSHFKTVWNLLVVVVGSLVSVFGIHAAYRRRKYFELTFVTGTVLTLILFYLLSGNFGMEPGVLRYALVLLNPTLISFAILIGSLEGPIEKKQVFGIIFLFIWLFQTAYFFYSRIQTHNSNAHVTYMTGEEEPKAVAFKRVLSNLRKRPTTVLVEDWWTFWPLRYLALGIPEVSVELYQGGGKFGVLSEVLERGGIVIGPVGGAFEEWMGITDSNRGVLKSEVHGFANRRILTLWAKQ